jgi:hypothetical protein
MLYLTYICYLNIKISIDIYSTAAMDEDTNEFSSSKFAIENKEKSKYNTQIYKQLI